MHNGRRAAWIPAALVTLALAVAAPVPARADSLERDEIARVLGGDTVTRETTMEDGEHHYVGGVTYTLVDATLATLEALFDDVAAYRQVLPRTKSAIRLDVPGPDTFVELHQGNSIFETSYVIRVQKDLAHRTVRFWLDPTRPHGIDDAWGFFRWTPTSDGRVLLTFGAVVYVGPGLVRAFFEERVRAAMLSVPSLVRGYVGRHRAA